jgi:hypothetical protein
MRCACMLGFFAVVFFWNVLCFGQAVSSADLIAKAKERDGKQVAYSGEVIGDVMKRGDFAWANIHDGANAVGVWLTAEMAAKIQLTGGFKHSGDLVEVTGIFNRACVEHGGDMDIHAQSLSLQIPGMPTPHGCDKDKKDLAIKLLGVLIIIWILSLLKIR